MCVVCVCVPAAGEGRPGRSARRSLAKYATQSVTLTESVLPRAQAPRPPDCATRRRRRRRNSDLRCAAPPRRARSKKAQRSKEPPTPLSLSPARGR